MFKSGSKLCMAIDAKEIGSAFVCVSRPAAAANCKTGALCRRSLRVAKEREFGLAKGEDVVQDELPFCSHEDLPMPAQTLNAPALDGVVLRPMTAADLSLAHALTTELRWPHRPADWAQVFAHAAGIVAERDGELVGTALRWRWGDRHASIGLVIVSPACQGRRLGHRLMSALLEELEDCTVLLHATAEGRGLYERLGFVRTGELRQHQGVAHPAPLVALPTGWRLRPPARARRHRCRRSMPRHAACRAMR